MDWGLINRIFYNAIYTRNDRDKQGSYQLPLSLPSEMMVRNVPIKIRRLYKTEHHTPIT